MAFSSGNKQSPTQVLQHRRPPNDRSIPSTLITMSQTLETAFSLIRHHFLHHSPRTSISRFTWQHLCELCPWCSQLAGLYPWNVGLWISRITVRSNCCRVRKSKLEVDFVLFIPSCSKRHKSHSSHCGLSRLTPYDET